jgi:hypothetical protein
MHNNRRGGARLENKSAVDEKIYTEAQLNSAISETAEKAAKRCEQEIAYIKQEHRMTVSVKEHERLELEAQKKELCNTISRLSKSLENLSAVLNKR